MTRIEYRAPAGCPPVAEFDRRLRARSSRVRLTTTGPAARTLYVEIVRREGGMTGTLRVVESGGAERRRSLKATRCDDTVDGLALVAAVALDPEAGIATAGPDNPGETARPSPPATSSPPVPTSSTPPASPSASPAPPASTAPGPPLKLPTPDMVVPLPRDQDTRGSERVRPGSAAWRIWAGLSAGGLFGQAPGALPAFMLFVASEWSVSPLWSPLVRASILRSAQGEFAEQGGTVRYQLTMGMAEACPFRFGPPLLALRPCLAGTGGVAEISGTQTVAPQAHTRWRWHAGGSTMLVFRVAEEVDVAADAGFLIPMRRDRYQFMPRVFFSDPAVSAFVRLDVGVAFP